MDKAYALLVLSIGLCSCSGYGEKQPIHSSRTEAQTTDQSARQEPWVGATVTELENNFSLVSKKLTMKNGVIYGVYENRNKIKYHIYFSGTPLKITFWSALNFYDVELRDIHELQNDTGFNFPFP